MPRSISIFPTVLLMIVFLILSSCTSESPVGSTAEAAGNGGAEESPPSPAEDSSESEPETGESIPADAATASAVLDSLYAESGDSEAALDALEEAGVQDMDEESRLVYAVLLRNEGRLDESRRQLEELVSDNPDQAVAWFNLALLELGAGNEEARDEALDRALEADDSLAEAHALRGNLAIADSNWSRAESSLKKSLQYDGDNPASLVGLAWVYAKTDRLEASVALLDKAVELEPEFVYARVDRSRVNVSLGNYNDAEDDLDAAVELEPDVPWHYLDRARIRLRHFQDYGGALDDLEMVEKLDPGNFFALVYLAGLHDEQRRFSISKDYYEQVVEARSDYVWAYMPLGKFAWMEGRFRDAANWYAKAAAEDPDEFSFSLMAGLALARAGDKAAGDKILKDLARYYDSSDVEYEVIRFCLERGSDYYAVNALNKAEDETKRERLWFYLGAVYESEGNSISAQSVFERLAMRRGEPEYDLAWAALNGMDG